MAPFPALRLVNPLPFTLAHYHRELLAVLAAAGEETVVRDSPSAELAGQPWRRAVVAGQLVLCRLLDTGGPTIVTWPVFGRADPMTWRRRRSGGPIWLVVHDPEPLRDQPGMGPLATSLGRRAAAHSVRTLVHGQAAQAALRVLDWPEVQVLPHPILPPADGSRPGAGRRDGIVVVGQWKPVRSRTALAALASQPNWDGRRWVHGRGWPELPGWQVDARFLSESELTSTLEQAQCLVLPYDRYFQSGVAVRALECLTPVVGQRHPFLVELLGADWPGLVEDDDWAAATERASIVTDDEMVQRRRVAWRHCLDGWTQWSRARRDSSAVRPG